MKCEKHGKDIIGTCQWCGRPLCKFDVGKKMGKKMFCSQCSIELGSYIQRKQLEQIKEEKAQEEKKKKLARMIFKDY
ncbi:MAG: hypothetical protein N3D84_02005 [Candidatus Woesearchaeota archaeon]|nr:hypothetical protein [Candidatus Woesearchaeota archaeon]